MTMFEGTLEEFKGFIEKEWAWHIDGCDAGDEWEIPMGSSDMLPRNPATYLDELEAHFGNELAERLVWAKKQNDSRAEGLQAAIERWNADEPLRKSFCVLVRNDIGRIQIDRSPYLETILLFEAAGFELRPDDFRGALHKAAQRDYGDSIPHLVSRGFDLEARDEQGRTPLDIATALGNESVIAAIMTAKAQMQADALAKKHGISHGGRSGRGGAL